MIIYKATSPSLKVYIGITSETLEIRKGKHYRAAKLGTKYKFHKALRKYKNNIIWEILEICDTWENAKIKEQQYIQFFNSFKIGYNSTLGGEGQLGTKPMLGKKHSKATIKKMSLAKLGKPKTLEMANKISKLHKGRIQKIEHINKCLNSRHLKSFIISKLNGDFVGEFKNQSQCARLFNLNPNLISACLTSPKTNKSHKGFIFKYKE